MENYDNDHNKELLSWSFNEYDPKPRSNSWYLWFGILGGLFVIYSVFAENFLFAVIIILFILIIFLNNWHQPDTVEFKFKATSLQIGEGNYPLKEINEFWIAYEPPHVEKVYFEFKSPLRPLLGIPLEGNSPLQVREVLLRYLPENLEKEDEPFADGMARFLRL